MHMTAKKTPQFDESTQRQIHEASGRFAAMAGTYGMGVFNDSFFRQAAILLAVAGGRDGTEGWIMAVFTLPYLLFASFAGWLADRFAKRHIVICAKVLELAAMCCGAVGICTNNWAMFLAMVFTMGAQSCLFSPALNGSIPELYPDVYVCRANATLKVVVTVMILTGVATSGLALSVAGVGWWGVSMGRLVVAVVAVVVSLAGVMASFGVPHRPAANPAAKFPWSGPAETLRQLREIRRDRLLAIVVVADVFVWFAGSMLILLISVLAIRQFGCREAMAGYMVAAEVVGVAIGGVIGSRLAVGKRWYRILPPAALAMAVLLLAMPAVVLLTPAMRVPMSMGLLGLVGIMGGMFMVPCEAFVQVRPSAERKGTVIASVNFAIFAGILLSGPIEIALVSILKPSVCFAVLGGLGLLVSGWLWWALGREDAG
jgi:MFS family permease